jgi:polysaccharide export outer membrane protein
LRFIKNWYKYNMTPKILYRTSVLCFTLVFFAGCSTVPSSGPSGGDIDTSQASENPIIIVDLNASVAATVLQRQQYSQFSETFGQTAATTGYIARAGDVLEVSIWEAPPATLFSAGSDLRTNISASRSNALPEQVVAGDGTINIPFAGQVPAAGRTTKQIENEILKRLNSKANQPQVLVRIMRNNTSTATVVGEVRNATRLALTPGKERLLDALAAAGGSAGPVNKTSLQLTRGDQVRIMSLDAVIRDPKQNIALQPGDVVTALTLSQSFTVLGAANRNEEINFEANGISLAQALGRVGGLQDNRADPKGVFIFRFEEPGVVNASGSTARSADGRVPVIYRINMKDPATFFVAQSFPIQNKDVMYVSNASSAEFQKFLNIILSATYPILNIYNATQ